MKHIKKPEAWLPLIIASALAIGIAVGVVLNSRMHLSSGQEKLGEILSLINNDYVDEVSIDSLIEQSLPDLIANLDPHSNYIPAKDLKAVNDELEGSFSGIGISFTMFTDTITVNEVIPGGPSEKAGILPGDRIVSINDSVVAGMGIAQTDIVKRLRGMKGSVVKLGIRRSTSKKPLTFEVTRGDIPLNSVDAAYMISPETGYIKVNKFGRTTYDEFLTALARLTASGAGSFIVDLRGNGGGFLEMAIMMANEFLPIGSPIVETRGRHESENSAIASDGNGSFQNAGLVVLLDEYSASASEIFAGAMQDNDRALIVGRRSFGKGLVQRQITLPDSSAVRLTVQRYYTPSGRCIQKDYRLGERGAYEQDITKRYEHGEFFASDSIHLNKEVEYHTIGGRKVYGGGGIMPDVFVPNDTVGISSYYINVLNAGLLQKFAFQYTDRRRETLSKAANLSELLRMLPSDEELLQQFVSYASSNGVPARWYYINISHRLIVNYLKALIASDTLGRETYYQVANTDDTTVQRALRELTEGRATAPITAGIDSLGVHPVRQGGK
ncbi:S41 family peptidase [Muribaculum intestinale]|uniref:S41 family peptidase n=1 Tax=Muribaculum intestinale TaxID=1796646 RepID=UPI0025A95F37|nr:S41 family peptidase [Muribaculum intestinale]